MGGIVFGLLAGLWSALAYGSFAVPIKAKAIVEAKSYKSLMCFTLSWLVLFWSPFRFTWWAVLAALIWVINGVLAILSIHLAGLGVAQSLWSCISMFVSFAWGKLLFQEAMANVALTIIGLLLMAIGMLGLGWIAAKAEAERRWQTEPKAAAVAVVDEIFAARLEPEAELEHLSSKSVSSSDLEQQRLLYGEPSSAPAETWPKKAQPNLFDDPESFAEDSNFESATKADATSTGGFRRLGQARPWWETQKFGIGVGIAVVIGVLAGTMMVCLKLAPPDKQGDQYTVSFGIGVAMVTVSALLLVAGVSTVFGRKPPSFQVRVAAGPACLAGVLWTLGNYLSIVAVDELGMAVGWPIVQCSLIVSNTWALFWYREITGSKAVLQFLCCSVVILAGVFLLAWFGL